MTFLLYLPLRFVFVIFNMHIANYRHSERIISLQCWIVLTIIFVRKLALLFDRSCLSLLRIYICFCSLNMIAFSDMYIQSSVNNLFSGAVKRVLGGGLFHYYLCKEVYH